MSQGLSLNGVDFSYDASRILSGHDFYEGVRAVIVDKDNTPRWQPAALADVADADIQVYFAPLDHELPL